MDIHCLFCWCALLLVSAIIEQCCSLEGSFYGDSFIHVPMEDATGETDLKLNFRTHRPNGLLFLAAGDTDYCAVELEAGMILVRIDLGSGEAILRSPPGLVFNDLRSHMIHVSRIQAEIQLKIDDIYITTETTPGRFFELNINHGVYLGGMRTNNGLFFGLFKKYRGCLEDVVFNSVDVLKISKEHTDPMNRYGVTWDCSSEFSATSELPITFLSNKSFIAFPGLMTRPELVRFTFDIRTRSQNALFLYHSGRSYNSDFLVVEILNGQISLTVNKGNGAIEFVSRKTVDDGSWHQIEVVIDPINIRLGVDGVRKERRTNFGENQFLDLDGYLYVGGLDVKTRAKAMRYQLPSLGGANAGGGSMIGCIQNFKINGELYGFREADITKSIRPECLWSFPCTNMPCVEGAECIEEGYYHYRCVCDKANCFKTGTSGESPSLPVSNVIHVQDIVVREGESSLISTNNIDLLVDYDGYGIAPSDVRYIIVNEPQYGYINVISMAEPEDQEIELTEDGRKQVFFTQLDLLNDRVSFVHDDSESYSDSVGIELKFKTDTLPDDANIPAKFKKTYGITIIIQIAPWNDRPVLFLPDDNALVLVENTFVVITPDLIEAEDRDDRPRNLEYTVQYQQGHDVGYFEIADLLGTRARITRFTQEDINESRVKFVHRGAVIQNFRIQVSDGKDTSGPQILRVQAVPLKLRLEENTGLDLLSGGMIPLTKSNLSYSTNALSQHIDIRYEITDTTYYGEIQRKQLSQDQWIVTVDFTQEDIDEGRIRYRHFPIELPETDYFHYRVHAMDVTTQDFQFFIHVTPVRVNLTKNMKLMLLGEKEGQITVDNLKAISTVDSHTDDDIIYSVLNPPSNGDIFKRDRDNIKLKFSQGNNFTQNDINEGLIFYRLHRTSKNVQRDHFQFRLLIPGGDDSSVNMFDIKFEPSQSEEKFVNNLLTNIKEGDKRTITMDDLYIETHQYQDYNYQVAQAPKHGVLQIIEKTTGRIIVLNATAFANNDIRSGQLYYSHDDSENSEDSFDFVAVPNTGSSEELDARKFTGTFDIEIDLENDNEPYRVEEKVCNVVFNRGRVISLNDIQFIDPDVNFDNGDLEYSWNKEIKNGRFVKTNNHDEALSKFSQNEIENGDVYFIHSGSRFGRSVLWISDGKHLVSTLLEIRASDPFINVVSNTGIEVEKGKTVTIMPANLYIESNLDASEEDIKFILEVPPNHGEVLRNENARIRFTMKDILNKKMVYRHDGSNFLQDSFRFTAKIDDIQVQDVVRVNITTEDDVQPPAIVVNKILTVEERDRVTISKQYLKTEHNDFRDDDIVYSVSKQPSHGQLTFRSSGGEVVVSFTQGDINRRRLQYHNTEAGYLDDNFMFDVSNGVSALSQIVFLIDIVPVTIPLEVKDFRVSEGQGHVLNINIIKVANRHFINEGLQYVIVKEPSSGWIENIDNPLVKIVQFTHEQVLNEQIYYEHDGNDTIWDDFSVMVKSSQSNKQSNPHTIRVTVVPSNDQTPKVVTNEPLQVWVGSITRITSDHLKATDPDSLPEHLMFVISECSNGDVLLESNQEKTIFNFTQAHINRGEVMFMHTGEMAGLFHFQVSDGTNRGKRHTFEIQANVLELTLEHNLLEVFPGILQPITNKYLQTHTNDGNQFRSIVYTLDSKPIKGAVVIRYQNDSLFEVGSFSQEEVDQGLIAYRHVTAMRDISPQYDDFIFHVSTSYAAVIKSEMFVITIAYDNLNADNQNQLLDITPVMVEEGGDVVITRVNFKAEKFKKLLQEGPLRNPTINFYITEPPIHGELFIRGENVSVNAKFSERDLEGGHVVYNHDHSETLWDVFYFMVEIEYDEAGSRMSTLTKTVTPFNITIIPVNDQRYDVLTNYPYIELVQGFTANISKEELETIDADTPPEYIVYKIVDGPENGQVEFRDYPGIRETTFTQEDVNMGRVIFVQNENTMDSGAFYFSVSDGQFPEIYITFIIRVHPLTLEAGKMPDVSIIQGHVSAFLTLANFNVKTNGNENKIMYNVTRPPMYGQLYMNDRPVNQFSGKNISDGLLAYVQTDLSTVAKDSFEFNIYDIQNVLVRKKVLIKVVPLITRRATEPFQVSPGQTLTITLAYLDASELAKQTNSIPMYIITEQPKYGEIVKLLRYQEVFKRDVENGQTRLIPTPVSNFSHEDVKQNHIRYRAKSSDLMSPENDGFSYLLTAENVQSAPGKFDVVVVPLVKPTLPPKLTTKTTEKVAVGAVEEEVPQTENTRKDHLTIVIIVIVLTLCVIIGLIIYTCYKRRKAKEEKELEQAAMELAQKESEVVMVEGSQNKYMDPYRVGLDEGNGIGSGGVNMGGNVDPGLPPPHHSSPRAGQLYQSPQRIPIIITSESDDIENTERPQSGHSSLQSGSVSLDRPPSGGGVYGSGGRSDGDDDSHYYARQRPSQTGQQSPDDTYYTGAGAAPITQSAPQSPRSIHGADGSTTMSDHTQDSLGRGGVPTCKVTPLCDSQDSMDNLSRDSTLQSSSRKAEPLSFDWENADPELLQHCRTTNPVLHKTKHWV